MANNQLTDEELQTLIIELQQTAYRLNGTNSAYLMSDAIKPLRELQERRKAERDSEPVAWTDEEELRDANEGGSGYLFGIGHDANKFADPRRQIMLYRHAQQPTVAGDGRAEFETWMLKCWGRERRDDDFAMGKFIYGEDYADSYTRCVWKAWSASRAAMLAAAPQEVNSES